MSALKSFLQIETISTGLGLEARHPLVDGLDRIGHGLSGLHRWPAGDGLEDLWQAPKARAIGSVPSQEGNLHAAGLGSYSLFWS